MWPIICSPVFEFYFQALSTTNYQYHAHGADLCTYLPQETIGSWASPDMQKAGISDKEAAVEEMRAAKDLSDEQAGGVEKNETMGRVEQTLGDVTGCEGMKEEGAKRQA